MQGHRSGTPGNRYMRVRPRRRRLPRFRLPRSIYWVVAAGAIALGSGFAVGALTFGPFAFSPQQTGATGTPPPPPTGISFPLAEAQLVSNNNSSLVHVGGCASSNLGTNATPTALVNGTNTTICLTSHGGGYALGDLVYVLYVAWNKTAALSTTFQVEVSLIVSPSANSFTAASYVKTSATIASHEGALFVADLTQANDTALNHYSVLVTEE